MGDFVPRNDAEFDNWARNFCQYVTEKTSGNPPEWPHIPWDKVKLLNQRYEYWYDTYVRCLKPHSEVETEAKNAARAALEKEIRLFKKLFIDFSPEVSNASRRAMKVTIRGKPRVTDTEPGGIPEISADTSVMRKLSFRYGNRGSKSRGKPRGVHGLEYRYAILDHFPEGIEELVRDGFSTSSPFDLYFTEADRGRKLYHCGRWESNTGKKGPWGTIEMAIIP